LALDPKALTLKQLESIHKETLEDSGHVSAVSKNKFKELQTELEEIMSRNLVSGIKIFYLALASLESGVRTQSLDVLLIETITQHCRKFLKFREDLKTDIVSKLKSDLNSVLIEVYKSESMTWNEINVLNRISADHTNSSNSISNLLDVYQTGATDLASILVERLSSDIKSLNHDEAMDYIRILRLGKDPADVRRTISKITSYRPSILESNQLIWEEACLLAKEDGSTSPLIKLIRKRKIHRTFKYVALTELWQSAIGMPVTDASFPNSDGLKKLAKEHQGGKPWKALLDTLLLFRLANDEDYGEERNERYLCDALDKMETLPNIEFKILTIAAAKSISSNYSNQWMFKSLTEIYARKSREFSSGISDDAFGIKNARAPSKRVKTGFAERSLTIGGMTANLASIWLMGKVKRIGKSPNDKMELLEEQRDEIAVELRRNLSILKGSWSKLGQVGAFADQYLPKQISEEMKALRIHHESIHYSTIEKQIKDDLGDKFDDFLSIDPVPIGNGSIAQVHSGILKNGTKVAIKIKYPNMEKAVKADIQGFKYIMILLKMKNSSSRVKQVISEIKENMLRECDLVAEVAMQKALTPHLRKHEHIIVPELYEDYCTQNIIVMDFVDQMDYETFIQVGSKEARNTAAVSIFKGIQDTYINHKVLNFDPHPGNFLFSDNGDVTFLDFGAFTKTFMDKNEEFKIIYKSILLDDAELFKKGLLEVGLVGNQEEFDYSTAFTTNKVLNYPFLCGFPFKFTRETITKMRPSVEADVNANKQHYNVPEGWVFNARKDVVLASLLAELEAEVDWSEIMVEMGDITAEDLAIFKKRNNKNENTQ
jgi:predicted unusual protein kinase regulating ubiquinone biosynthesis (AarF/ABC1/UbiB family)